VSIWSVVEADCFVALDDLEPESVDAVVTDPPYSLGFMGKEWDSHVDYQTWSREWAKAALRALKPGGHVLSFSAPRTYHRMACGIEDAGFEIRDALAWMFGTGFPKSLDVSKAIDKSAGVEREVVGSRVVPDASKVAPPFAGISNDGDGSPTREIDVTVPSSEEAKLWDGWGTALKPAWEPIVVARKPLVGTVAENVLAHGTGALNVDASLVGIGAGSRAVERPKGSGGGSTSFGKSVLFTHSPECRGETARHPLLLCHPGCPVRLLAEQSGGAERFFYSGKAATKERVGGLETTMHPTVKPIDLMRWLVRLVTPDGGLVLDPFLGSGSTGCAALLEGYDFIGIEREPEYAAMSRARLADMAFAAGGSRAGT
jgi:site-specific DNA-methyltransferase (adenine-specific)